MKLDAAKKDVYRKRAKKDGLRSRSAYKLLQIDSKYQIFENVRTVVDFGCSPGGWLQVASEKIGSDSFILGVDIAPVEKVNNIKTVVIDVREKNVAEVILSNLPRAADAILSDMAPNLSGIWDLDHAQQIDLTSKVIEMMPKILKKGGIAVLKVFDGEMLEEFLQEVRLSFENVKLAKPEASRTQSSEIYLVCKGYCRE